MQTEELPIHFPAKRLALSKIEGTHPSLLIIILPALLLIAIASIAGTVILFNDLASDYQHGIILMLAVAAFSLGYFAHLLRQYSAQPRHFARAQPRRCPTVETGCAVGRRGMGK